MDFLKKYFFWQLLFASVAVVGALLGGIWFIVDTSLRGVETAVLTQTSRIQGVEAQARELNSLTQTRFDKVQDQNSQLLASVAGLTAQLDSLTDAVNKIGFDLPVKPEGILISPSETYAAYETGKTPSDPAQQFIHLLLSSDSGFPSETGEHKDTVYSLTSEQLSQSEVTWLEYGDIPIHDTDEAIVYVYLPDSGLVAYPVKDQVAVRLKEALSKQETDKSKAFLLSLALKNKSLKSGSDQVLAKLLSEFLDQHGVTDTWDISVSNSCPEGNLLAFSDDIKGIRCLKTTSVDEQD